MTGTFQDLYRQHVAPKLRHLCFKHGTLVVCGFETFSEAHATISREAYRLGAAYLPKKMEGDLADAISTWLLEEIDKAEAISAEEDAKRIERCA